MFGHQDHDTKNTADNNSDSAATAPNFNDQIRQLNDPTGQTPTIAPDSSADNISDREVLSPAGGYPQATAQRIRKGGDDDDRDSSEQPPSFTPPPPDSTPPNVAGDDLNSIKQQVISELFPLIDELQQTPDERFKTLMMMIQATDNQTLIKSAYEAAHGISDSKQKAQALLDILNEINYFTHTDSLNPAN